jgi:hypothetical protein
MAQLQVYPFGLGLHQENDSRLQTPGVPRAIENLVRQKNGRLVKRRDYETLAMTVEPAGQSDLQLHDLHSFDGRLLGIGSVLASFLDATPQRGATTIYDFVDQANFAWVRTNQGALSPATQVRNVGALGKQRTSVTVQDVAAGLGIVCEVFDVLLGSGNRSVVHVFDPEKDATIFMADFTSRSLPRVVFCGGVFFVTLVITATGEIELWQYTPGATSMVQLTSPVAASATIDAYDFATSYEGTTMWIAAARSNTTTALRGMNSAGTVTYTAAGPAVLYDSLSILVHSTVAATQRLHILGVRDTTGTIDLVTYLPPATVPATTSNDIFNADTTARQASLAVRDLSAGTTQIVAMYQDIVTGGSAFYDRVIVWRPVDAVTHALGVREFRFGSLTSKLSNIDSILAFGLTIQDSDTQFTACLGHVYRSQVMLVRPVTVIDRGLAAEPSPFHLPKLTKDTSTGLSYWPHLTQTSETNGQPRITELKLNGTDRRQSTELGGALYIAGGIMHVFDQRCIGEAGGFLTRPFIYELVGLADGSLETAGIYQVSAKFELFDSLDRRMQSAPSELKEHTLTGADNGILARITGVFSYWDNSAADLVIVEARAVPFMVTYRTQDTNGGQITLHQDQNQLMSSPWEGAGVSNVTLDQSDVDISDNEVLYTQGARGALSGPLEFICPDPCTSVAASADRVLSGGLPRDSAFQESRPLLVGEQVQWSDSIGFYRDIRGRILAVARLDERRIIFTEGEIFEADGPGVDDNGLGEIGAPRRLPSDVGLYGGVHGWRSIVEMSAGILFQGLRTQLYLLPRGGVTPVAIGFAVEDTLDAYPVITSATYLPEDQTVRFTCNDDAGTESIVLLFNVRFGEWFTEGPYAFTIRAATKHEGRFVMLTSGNAVMRQRTSDVPLVYVPTAWRSDVLHPFKPGMFGQILAVWFYGRFKGDTRARAVVRFDDGDPVYHEWIEVHGLTVGEQFVYRFEFEATSCESIMVDFEFEALQGQATEAVDYNFFALEIEPSNTPYLIGPENRT